LSAAGCERIAAAFAAAGPRAAVMPYLMGGFPDREASLAIGMACIDAGADLLELGVPFSDPLADGPVIHAAATCALAQGTTVADVLSVAEPLAQRVPVVLMVYANVVLAPGAARFLERVAQAGIAGLIVPDLPFEERAEIAAAAEQEGVALVPLVAPTTTPERLAAIGARARGFVYVVSVTGTTGERARNAGDLAGLLARAKAATAVPVAVGFGIATPEQAVAAAAAGADGVIVGSRLVRAALEAAEPAAEVGRLVREIAEALSAAVA
jgi:tryptophan synthase alpha chain